MTYKNSGLKDVLPEIGLEHLVLETDSPYLTPVPHRGKRNESAYIRFVADEIAHVLGKSVSIKPCYYSECRKAVSLTIITYFERIQ